MIIQRSLPLVLAFLVSLLPSARAVKQLWSANLPDKVEWHNLNELGTILVGTKGAVLSFDPDTGRQLWSRPDLSNIAEFNVSEVAGTPYLLTTLSSGSVAPRSPSPPLTI